MRILAWVETVLETVLETGLLIGVAALPELRRRGWRDGQRMKVQ